MNSRAKGARAEREVAKLWSLLWGVFARRGQQFSGGTESPDVVHGLDGVHVESKCVERGNPYDWIEQAVNDAGDNIPVVVHRRNRKPWLLIVRLEDAPKFVLAAAGSPAVQAMGLPGVPPAIPCEGVRPQSLGYEGIPGVLPPPRVI